MSGGRLHRGFFDELVLIDISLCLCYNEIMVSEKQTVHRLYTSGSADFVDENGDVRPIADFDERTMETADENFPPLFVEAAAVVSLKHHVNNRRKPRHSRRGGRAYNEGSDSEHDPFWNVPVEPVSPEQAEINRRGIQMVRDELARLRAAHDEK